MNILIYSKVGGFAEIIRNFYNVKQFYGCTLSLFQLLRQESFLCNSIVGAMTVAKLIHEKDKVMQGGVAVAEEGVLEQ